MDSSVEDVKNKIDVVEYIGQFVTLKKAGRNFKGLCPFHGEKSPSFVVSPDRQIWRCFGACQEGGDVISFLMKWENITFFEALQELAKMAGVTLKNVNFEDEKWKKKEVLIKINNLSAKYFSYLLEKHASAKSARSYLKNREVNAKLSKTFQLGYAPDSWNSLLKFLQVKGFDRDDVLEAGLVIRNDRGRYYDRFRGRLMFPIIDARDVIVGFSGRLLSDESKQAKYVNTPETPLYHKRKTLYGMHAAKDSIRKEKKAIIVEGEFDMISLYRGGYKNTVAIKGSAFTIDQLKLLKRSTQHLILALDADFSGAESTLRAITDAEKMDFRIDVARFDFGKDPDEAIQKDPVNFKKIIKNPIPIYDFIIDLAVERHSKGDAYDKKEIANDVIPFIQPISNPIVKSHYIKKLADILEVDENTVETMNKKFEIAQHKKKRDVSEDVPKKINKYEIQQKYILSMALQNENPVKVLTSMNEVLSKEDFSIPSYQDIFDSFERYLEKMKENTTNGSTFNVKVFAENLSSPLQSVFDDLLLFDLSRVSYDNADMDLKRTLYQLKRHSLKDKLKKGLKGDTNSKEITKLTKELARVEKELGVM